MKKVLIIAILALNVVSLSYLVLSQSKNTFNIGSAVAEDGNSDNTVKALNQDVSVTISETSTCTECAGTIVTTQTGYERTCPTPDPSMTCEPKTQLNDPTVTGHAESCSLKS